MLNLMLFRNTSRANDKYPVWDCDNLPSPIEMQLSLKPKTFSDFFLLFLESTSNFQHFEKQDDPHTYFITEITGCERLG